MKNTDTHKVVLPTGDTSGKAATPAFTDPVTTGTLQIDWPGGNVLVDPKARSPLAAIPAYKEISATLA
jgi:hypothetical protein